MKNFISTLVLFMAISTSLVAQDRSSAPVNARTKAYQITRIMSDQLRLNESEYIRLRTLNEERVMQTEEAAVEFKNDLVMKDAKLKEIEDNFDRQVQGMLTARQLDAYLAFKENPPVNYTAFINEESRPARK
jgi:hypothetical protein